MVYIIFIHYKLFKQMYEELYNTVKSLEKRIVLLEKENKDFKKNIITKKKKFDIIEYLNDDIERPTISFHNLIQKLDYAGFLEVIFKDDLITGIIKALEHGTNSISILDCDKFPLRIFLHKNIYSYYIYDFDLSNNTVIDDLDIVSNLKWTLITNEDFNNWLSYIANRFLNEFKLWAETNQQLIDSNENMSNKFIFYFQKLLGGNKMNDEGRNTRLKQYIYKNIKPLKF